MGLGAFLYFKVKNTKNVHTLRSTSNVLFRPEKGAAVYWHNINRAGYSDMHMLHAACPVLLGRFI